MSGAVLVFGASGFVGRNLVDRLAADGREVFAVTGSGRPVPGATRTVALASIGDLGALPADIVACHLAAYRYDAGRFDLAQSDILLNNNELNGRILHCNAAFIAVHESNMSKAVGSPDQPRLDNEKKGETYVPPSFDRSTGLENLG